MRFALIVHSSQVHYQSIGLLRSITEYMDFLVGAMILQSILHVCSGQDDLRQILEFFLLILPGLQERLGENKSKYQKKNKSKYHYI